MTPANRESERLGHDSEAIAGFLPLVDVLLAVLCVALVAAGAARSLQVPVTLPTDRGRAHAAPSHTVTLQFDREGRTVIDGVAVPIEHLTDHLRRLDDRVTLLIAGDATTPYEQVARILHRVRQADIEGVQLVLRRP